MKKEEKKNKVYISAEVLEEAVKIVNTYGNKKTKYAFDRLVEKVNNNKFGPVIVQTYIDKEERND